MYAMPEPRGRCPMPRCRSGPPQKINIVRNGTGKGFCGTCGEVGEGNKKNCLNPGLGPEPRRRSGPPSHPLRTGR